ncbi:hypothetical protein BIU96_04030 [Curtobacterium sp. MCBA15_008]|nr:hypothetical protein BIU96_04030 [Curtobacterium sp. MCBA15_008]
MPNPPAAGCTNASSLTAFAVYFDAEPLNDSSRTHARVEPDAGAAARWTSSKMPLIEDNPALGFDR